MTTRSHFDPYASVALSEPQPLDAGWADLEAAPEHPGADVIPLRRRPKLFGFARAVVEAPPEPRFRTALTFRRLWPGEARTAVETQTPTEPRWRTVVQFHRAEPAGLAAVAAYEHTEAPQILNQPEFIDEPSSIDPAPLAATDNEPQSPESPEEPEVIVEPEIVVPDPDAEPTVAVAAEETEPAPEQGKRKRERAPRPKNARRGGGSKGRRLVGLKVGSSQLAAAVVANDGTSELTQLARTPFEQGIVVDGEVRDEDALAAALKDFFAQAKLPTRDVRIGLASNRIGVRTLDMTGVDEEHFDNAVRFKAHEVLPIAMNESVLDYRVIEERVEANGEKTRRVLLVVAPRDTVEPYVGACRKAGVRLTGIDLEAFALLRAFVEPRPTGEGAEQAAIVVVSIGHEATTLVVSGAGICEFTRVFGWGGAQLDAAISAACGLNQVEAAAIKTQLSLTGELPAGVDAAVAGKALEAVRTELTLFARELVSSLQFYQKQPDSLGIGEVVVSGGTSQLGGLAESLHTLVGVPVRLGDPLARVAASTAVAADPTVADTLGSLSVAIGLGIEDEAIRAVNLLPADAATATRRRPTLAQALVPAAALVPLVALGALLLPANSAVDSRTSELADLNTELAMLPQPQGPGIDQGIKGEQARRAAVVADVLSRRTAWDRTLRQLSLVVPRDVWLTELRGAAPRPLSVVQVADTASTKSPPPPASAAAATPTGITITGRTFKQSAVATLLARLETVPTLSAVQLTRSGFAKAGTRTVIEFEIAANLRSTGEAS